MNIIRSLSEWQAQRAALQDTVGLVPTMGALHAGHAALLEQCVAENTISVLSIFVNPTQFNNPEDLDHYPNTLEEDLALARSLGVDFVLLPSYEDLYADDYRYQVVERSFSKELCGAHRPGHFDGVLTVVLKLLNMVQPQRAYFGEKDYQQYALVRDMCQAFLMPVTIVACATVRETDGLAMSSRNLRLTPADRALAPDFARLLRSGLSDEQVSQALQGLGFDVDYIVSRDGRRFGAASLGAGAHCVRLIDNVALIDANLAEAS